MAMVIDIHAHPVSRDRVRDARNLRLMDRDAACLTATDAVELLLDRMDRGGITRACLMGPAHGDGIALTNQDVRDAVLAHPDRFIGFVGADPITDQPKAVGEMIRVAVRDWGFRGVGEFANVDLLDARCEVVYDACMELDVPLMIHTGVPLPSMLLRHGHPFGVDELAHRHPELTIIAAHLGMPWVIETVAVAVRHPNVYLDVSALPMFNTRLIGPLLALSLDKGLADRLLFGSDFPLVDPASYARRMRSAGPGRLLHRLTGLPRLTARVRQMILGGNAARLLKLADEG
jgi:predicted TIM-barrel fold metal-dependent hydrolase